MHDKNTYIICTHTCKEQISSKIRRTKETKKKEEEATFEEKTRLVREQNEIRSREIGKA